MSLAHPDDPRFRLVDVERQNQNPDADPDQFEMEFTFRYPYVDVSTGSRNTTHEPIGAEPVVQHLGPSSKSVEIHGECYKPEANFVDSISQSARVRVISHRWSGFGIVDTAKTMVTGKGGGHEERPNISDRVFEYRISLVEIQPDPSYDADGGVS